MSVVTILGAGVMGSAMCLPAADNGHAVRLVGTHLDAAIIDSVRGDGRHPKLNVTLPDGVEAYHYTGFSAALGNDTDLLVLGISSAGIGWAIDRLCDSLTRPVPVVMITKGLHATGEMLEPLPFRVRSEVSRRTGIDLDIAAIGGPCIAGELAVRRQTGTVIASLAPGLSHTLCDLLETPYYHPRPSADVVGTEVCAAFKNFFAIAVGWAVGHLETLSPTENRALNHNAAALIFAQAIRELSLLTVALGGEAASASGMPGAGDLYVTCQAGRNSRLGQNLGRGLSYRQTTDGPMRGDTIEGAELGVAAAASLSAMMQRGQPPADALPLTRALLSTLVDGSPLELPWTEFSR